uniref:Uncharacterized protein n=1 Tax=Solanum tuberosum TaxID=4113 RepID=M1DVE1_SOLTU
MLTVRGRYSQSEAYVLRFESIAYGSGVRVIKCLKYTSSNSRCKRPLSSIKPNKELGLNPQRASCLAEWSGDPSIVLFHRHFALAFDISGPVTLGDPICCRRTDRRSADYPFLSPTWFFPRAGLLELCEI